jgi:hypothetical protein
MTGFVPAMWAVWGAFVLLVLVLKLYTNRLSKYEDDQLILDEAFSHVKAEQAAIMEKVHRIQPVNRAVLILTGAMTLVVVGYYVMEVINQFK